MDDSQSLMALVMAGGRLSGRDAAVVGTEVKALARIGGTTLLERVLSALSTVAAVRSAVVVGPAAVQEIGRGYGAAWRQEKGALSTNVQEGALAAREAGVARVLLIGSDLAAPKPESIADFLARSPSDAAVTVPLIGRGAFEAACPGSPSAFVSLREGEFTIGSQFKAPVDLLLDPPPAVAAMLGHRKSQIRMAFEFGPAIAVGLLTRSLTLPSLERRASEMLGVAARAVPDCGPDLGFDIDDAKDFAYARRLFENGFDPAFS